MKFALSGIALALLASSATATAPQKQVIISYPNDAPGSMIEEAMSAIKEAGGVILHEYNLIKGFAAKAPAKALEAVQALGGHENVVIEEDHMVTIQNS